MNYSVISLITSRGLIIKSVSSLSFSPLDIFLNLSSVDDDYLK